MSKCNVDKLKYIEEVINEEYTALLHIHSPDVDIFDSTGNKVITIIGSTEDAFQAAKAFRDKKVGDGS